MSRVARKPLELEVVGQSFEHFTAEMSQKIFTIATSRGCSDTSDLVVDHLWASCRNDLIFMLQNDLGEVSFQELRRPQYDLSISERESIRGYLEKALTYEAEIGDLDDDEFETLYRCIMCPIVEAERERKDEAEREADRWAFFNRPNADAVPGRWDNKHLSSAQAVALSFGKDPDVVSPSALANHRRPGRSPFKEEFRARLSQVENAIIRGEMASSLTWDEFALWASKNSILLVPSRSSITLTAPNSNEFDLQAQLTAAQAEIRRLNNELATFSTSRKRNAYKLILAMAATKFEYRTKMRSRASKLISLACEDVELPVSDETVHRYLQEATQDLDFVWPKPAL